MFEDFCTRGEEIQKTDGGWDSSHTYWLFATSPTGEAWGDLYPVRPDCLQHRAAISELTRLIGSGYTDARIEICHCPETDDMSCCEPHEIFAA